MNATTIIITVCMVILVLVGIGCSRRAKEPAAGAEDSSDQQAPIQEEQTPIPEERTPIEVDATPDSPRGFGRKTAWLAIETQDARAVIDALKLRDVVPANWQTGLATAEERYRTHVFVTPPVDGWVMVVGMALPDAGDSMRPDKCTPFLRRIGQSFDRVLYFGTHRVVDYHAWAKVERGKITRAYAYLGEEGVTLWNHGNRTREEQRLNFNFFADKAPEGQGDEYWDRQDLRYPGEDDVIGIAEAWSINPVKLEDRDLPPSVGSVGRMPALRK